MRILFTILSLLPAISLSGQSVLGTGEWRKVAVIESGVYRMDRDYLVNQLGFPTTMDPRKIRVFGSEFEGMLPQLNAVPRAFDPVEYPVYQSGFDDGVIQTGDFMLFYASGPDLIKTNADGSIAYEKNLYSDTAYYLINYGSIEARKMNDLASENGTGQLTNTYQEIIIYENDLVNKLKSGRTWLGEEFSNGDRLQRTFTYDLPGMLNMAVVDLSLSAESERACSFEIQLNNQSLGLINIDSIPNGSNVTYQDKLKSAQQIFETAISGSSLNLKLTFNRPAAALTSLGYLDRFILGVDRALSLYGSQTIFWTSPLFETRNLVVANTGSDQLIWNISNPETVSNCVYSINNDQATFGNSSMSPEKYVVFTPTARTAPIFIKSLQTQNIKSQSTQEGLIICAPSLRVQAERLASFHRSRGLSVGVVTTEQVYNEFAAGRQDITAIRDFIKYCYDSGGALRYVTLFGDGSYDYKNRVIGNTNLLPVYESRESFHPIFSHSSDDYYGFLDEDEGEWFEGKRRNNSTFFEVDYVDHDLEIGLGRIPVKNQAEAQDVVDKIIRYKTNSQGFGTWRNRVAYLSDDEDFSIHMRHAEELYQIFDTTYLNYSSNKIYLDSYEKIPGPPLRSPQTVEAVKKAFDEGMFIFNYIGHGGPELLTEESVITETLIDGLTNRLKLPLLVTATCDFGKYDDPRIISGAERFLLQRNGGAIALITTTRPVYAQTNFPVNQAFHENVFLKIDGKYPRLGDVIRATKNASLRGPINRNFALLGDPMMALNYPDLRIEFDQMKLEKDTLSALEIYRLSGALFDGPNRVEDFRGLGVVTVYDIPQQKVTRGQDNAPFKYLDQTNVLYRGQLEVVDGSFDITFKLPKNSSYKYQTGKIVVYAADLEAVMDASGATNNFVIGGTAPDTKETDPPSISMFLNDSTFINQGTVGSSSLLIARIQDASGINISNNGFNQNITLELNGGEPIILNDFYTADINTYRSGTVLFPLKNLEPGKYQAKLKVWDVHNNPADQTVQFTVSDVPRLGLFNVKAFPNPVAENRLTTLAFEHDRPGEELLVQVTVYDMMGSIVSNRQFNVETSSRLVNDLQLSMTNFQGSPLEKGIYLSKILVTSTLDGANNGVVKRILIVN